MKHDSRNSSSNARLPTGPIDYVAEPLDRFLHIQSASGVVLLVASAAALMLANSPVSEEFIAFWKTPIGLSIGVFEMQHSLKHWINDGLMVIFFFVIGLEVKRELMLGELRDLRAATLPLAAALGGMVVPAGFFLAFQWGEPGERGWGIPMATDIAFVMGCLALLGSRVPNGLRIFLLTLAIADDLGAILVIAVGYTNELRLAALAWGVFGIALVLAAAYAGVRSIFVYVMLGLGVWFGFHESGVHATIAGVVLGLLTPARPWVGKNLMSQFVSNLERFLQGDAWEDTRERQTMLAAVQRAAGETISPLERLETTLHPWVSFGIMPLFAFANAGVRIDIASFTDSVAIAVVVGLCVGKPVGIFVFGWLAVRLGLARLPEGVTWSILAAGGVLAGIGFTMSLFIAGLALQDRILDAAKIGTLFASALCAVAGMALLLSLLPQVRRGKM